MKKESVKTLGQGGLKKKTKRINRACRTYPVEPLGPTTKWAGGTQGTSRPKDTKTNQQKKTRRGQNNNRKARSAMKVFKEIGYGISRKTRMVALRQHRLLGPRESTVQKGGPLISKPRFFPRKNYLLQNVSGGGGDLVVLHHPASGDPKFNA